MKRLVLLDYDAESMHSDHRDPEAKAWFERTVLTEPPIVHSNEIGDDIGTIEPLPDQLTKDLDGLTNFAIGMADMLDERGPTNPERSAAVRASIVRLRAAAELDNE